MIQPLHDKRIDALLALLSNSGPVAFPAFWTQTLWVVDPQNVTGLASNNNTGLSTSSPLLTKAEIVRRTGPQPEADGILVTVEQISNDVGNDPLVWYPVKKNGGAYRYMAPQPAASFTGTLNAVTPKQNTTAPGNALASTFIVTTGAVAADMILINATRGNSRALAQRDLGGGNWQIAQPVEPYAGTGLDFLPNEVDTWAHGDSIVGFVPTVVDLVGVASVGDATNPDVIWRVTVPAFSGFGETLLLGTRTQISDCVNARGVASPVAYVATNVAQHGLGNIGPGAALIMNGWHACDFGTTRNIVADNDCIVGNQIVHLGVNGQFLVSRHAAHACIDGFVDWSSSDGAPNGFGVGVIYGGGVFDLLRGTMSYDSAGGTGVHQFLCAIRLNGASTGYSRVTTGGSVALFGGIPLDGAHLDAPAGATGFGGYAEGGGAVITNGSQP